MLIDTQTTFSGALALDGTKTAQGPITTTQLAINVIDLRSSGLGIGLPALSEETCAVWLVVQASQAFNNLTSLTISLESDSAASLASAPVVHAAKVIPLAALTAGATVLRGKLPSDDYKRYLGLRYTVNGAAPTTGTLLAYLVADPQRSLNFANGFAVL